MTRPPESAGEKKSNNMLLFGGIGVVALLVGCLVIAAILAATGVIPGIGGDEPTSEAGIIETEAAETSEAATSAAPEEATEIVAVPSETTTAATATSTSTPTIEPEATATEVPFRSNR
jgi:hypothetical protein